MLFPAAGGTECTPLPRSWTGFNNVRIIFLYMLAAIMYKSAAVIDMLAANMYKSAAVVYMLAANMYKSAAVSYM